MTGKFKRYLRKEIVNGKSQLPEELLFLSDSKYFAIAEQRVQGKREWYVEIIAASLKSLLSAKTKLNAARLSCRKLTGEINRLEDEAFCRENELLQAKYNNEILREQIQTAKMAIAKKVIDGERWEAEMSNKNAEIRNLKDELDLLAGEIEPLRQANAQLMKNSENDMYIPQQKGPKNFFAEMEERGVPLTGPAIQGGGGGSAKR